jgi:hypothetical protein
MNRFRTRRRQMMTAMAALACTSVRAHAASRPGSAVPFAVPNALPDAARLAPPQAVQVGGWLGERINANVQHRLAVVDTAPLLAGFAHKPGSHPWIGEHVGKWLHAATLAWAYSGDAALRRKLDQVAADLIATQEPDGYLGTYLPGQRLGLFENADWDVWSHKYALLGLLSFHQHTGNAAALAASVRAADLLLATFPAQRSILAAGTHQGMAATSVLEPMVLLYRLTGQQRYLDFARYIVRAWDEPGGPGIVKTLLQTGQVNQVANAKAYEMLSNLVGLAELARLTGQADWQQAVLRAWQDIVDQRLYATGATSQWEHFQAAHDLRGDVRAHVGETCVTTTWIQLNLVLLQTTGQARFGDEIERALYNHLTAAQRPRGDDWAYYTPQEGRKQYDEGITCCHSSGPRALALAPLVAYLQGRDAAGVDVLMVNTFEPSSFQAQVAGQAVGLTLTSGFPHQGQARLTLRLARPARFAIKWRAPAWAQPMTLAGATLQDGWWVLPARTWRDGQRLTLGFNLSARVQSGEHTQRGRAALAWGPFVLAVEQETNPGLPPAHLLRLRQPPRLVPGQALRFLAEVETLQSAQALPAQFVPFADAGAQHQAFRIWLRAPGVQQPAVDESLLIGGVESRSRQGDEPGGLKGSVIDEDFDS